MRDLAGLAVVAAFVIGGWLLRRRRALRDAKWVVFASGAKELARTVLIVAKGAPPPEPNVVAVTGCNTAEELLQYVLRPQLVDRVLLWPAPATEVPAPFLLIPGEAPAACAQRLQEALAVSSEEAARPPAIRAHAERASNRDLGALAPVVLLFVAALLLILLTLVDPFKAPPRRVPQASPVERICEASTALCDTASRANRHLVANECEAASEDANHLAATFIRLPESARTESLEQSINELHALARGCRPATE